MEVRIAVVPPAGVRQKAAVLAKRLARTNRHRFEVDNKKLFPHITLFKIDIPRKEYKAVKALLETITKKTVPFSVIVHGFMISPGGWLALDIKPSAKLTSLRQRLHAVLAGGGVMKERQLTSKYDPHITLTRFYKDEHCQMAIKGHPQPHYQFTVKDVNLCLSRNTQVYKILDTLKLK